jgi:hypothetical protein
LSAASGVEEDSGVQVLTVDFDVLVQPLADHAEGAGGWQRPQPVVPVYGAAAATAAATHQHRVVGLPEPVVRVMGSAVVLVRLLRPGIDVRDPPTV